LWNPTVFNCTSTTSVSMSIHLVSTNSPLNCGMRYCLAIIMFRFLHWPFRKNMHVPVPSILFGVGFRKQVYFFNQFKHTSIDQQSIYKSHRG
jgi:hypothetical protein